MESTASNEIVAYVLVGTLIMIILVISIIVFVTLSQRKSTKQLLKMQEMENQHQKDIFNSVIATQEKERQRIAKNLHDDIGTSLSAIGLLIGQIKNISEGEVKDLSIKIRTNIDGIVDASRRVISDLSPASLLRFGFFVELDNLTTLISESAKIKFFINTSLSNGRLRTELELTLYRIIKEFINNTIKYAKATEITILIELLDNTLHINIKVLRYIDKYLVGNN